MRGDLPNSSLWLGRISRRLPSVSSTGAWLLGGAVLAVSVLLRLALDLLAPQTLPPYITLYPAIVIAAFIGGIRLGIAAVLASAAIAWTLWIDPPTPDQLTPGRVATGAVFLFTGLLTALIAGAARALLDEQAAYAILRDAAAAESVHRIKNLLTIFQALSHASAGEASNVTEYRRHLDARLASLARAQDLLLASGSADLAAGDLVTAALAPFLPDRRFEIACDRGILVPADGATPVAMALYELATNSLKYGALASNDGQIRLVARHADGLNLIEWRESGLAH
jgi:two-component sensor histidine kinase